MKERIIVEIGGGEYLHREHQVFFVFKYFFNGVSVRENYKWRILAEGTFKVFFSSKIFFNGVSVKGRIVVRVDKEYWHREHQVFFL